MGVFNQTLSMHARHTSKDVHIKFVCVRCKKGQFVHFLFKRGVFIFTGRKYTPVLEN